MKQARVAGVSELVSPHLDFIDEVIAFNSTELRSLFETAYNARRVTEDKTFGCTAHSELARRIRIVPRFVSSRGFQLEYYKLRRMHTSERAGAVVFYNTSSNSESAGAVGAGAGAGAGEEDSASTMDKSYNIFEQLVAFVMHCASTSSVLSKNAISAVAVAERAGSMCPGAVAVVSSINASKLAKLQLPKSVLPLELRKRSSKRSSKPRRHSMAPTSSGTKAGRARERWDGIRDVVVTPRFHEWEGKSRRASTGS